MADQLVIANLINLSVSNEIPSSNPVCPGAMFWLGAGYSFGAPVPDVDFVASMIIDGERTHGERASNRTISLPIAIVVPATGPLGAAQDSDRQILAAARELLLSAINKEQWPLTWTRSGGSAMVLDCQRASTSQPVYSVTEDMQLVSETVITFPALPYGRSDTQTQISFSTPLPALNAPPPVVQPVVLDAFDTINSPQCVQTSQCVVGPHACYWDPGSAPANAPHGESTPLRYSRTFPSPLNLEGQATLGFWFGLGSRYYTSLEYHGHTKVNIEFTLTDSSGNTLGFSDTTRRIPVSENPVLPVFSPVSVPIPQNSQSFNYSSVASYSVVIRNRANFSDSDGDNDSGSGSDNDNDDGELRWTCAYIDALTAMPSSTVQAASSPRGALLTLHGVVGTAPRMPLSLQFQQPAVPGSPTTISAAGPGGYTVPGGTVYLKVEAIGGGGAGASETGAGLGGGGAGAEYAAELVFPAAVGQVIPYSVGTGGTSGATPANGASTVFGPAPGATLAVTAHGGQSAAQNSITAGLGGTGSTNSVKYPGGAGRTASGSVGGGGGSSAGSTGPGNTPAGTTGATLSGSGNWTAPPGVTQVTATVIGGGAGGGSGSASNNGGGGGGGESATQTFTVIPGNNYAYVTGGGGAGGAASGNPGAAGSSSTFTVGAVTLTGHGGSAGPSGQDIPGGNGGSGSTAPIHFSGGKGGNTDPYTGGGGSSAGPAAAGNPGNGYAAPGSAPSGGGSGGAGSGAGNGVGLNGVVPGGGGGGSYKATFAGGNGAAGTIVLSYAGGAPTNNGAIAVPGGGAGGAGGGSANTSGSAGSAPGGGGGGADSSGTAEAGGAGGAGNLVITPYASPAFKTLIVHRPGSQAPALINPLVPVGNGLIAPGATEFTVPSPIVPTALNSNSLFATVVTPWTAQNSATLTWSAAGWSQGPSALFTGNGTIANPGMISEATIPAAPQNSYTVSASLFSPQGFATCQAGIKWFDATSTQIGSTVFGSATAISAAFVPGTPLTVTAVAPPLTAFAQAVIQMTGTPANTVQIYADNAQFSVTVPAADFDGTYSLVLINKTWNNPSASRAISVTVKEYESVGGASYSTTTTTVNIVPNTVAGPNLGNGIVLAGVLTLPLKALPRDNTSSFFTVIVSDSNASDRFYDCLFFDTTGQTVIVSELTTGYVNYYINAPDPEFDIGNILGSQSGRPSAIAIVDACPIISGGPLTVSPGDNALLAYCPDAVMPAVAGNYYPGWWIDRTG
jgi:hypothetical protein